MSHKQRPSNVLGMSDEAMCFRIQCAVMQQFGLYWSPAGWLTRGQWAALMGDHDADLELDLDCEGAVIRQTVVNHNE